MPLPSMHQCYQHIITIYFHIPYHVPTLYHASACTTTCTINRVPNMYINYVYQHHTMYQKCMMQHPLTFEVLRLPGLWIVPSVASDWLCGLLNEPKNYTEAPFLPLVQVMWYSHLLSAHSCTSQFSGSSMALPHIWLVQENITDIHLRKIK